MIVILNVYLDLELGEPSYVTILVWVKKVGLFSVTRTKEKADDWILIMDESIDIGHEKLLVIFGVRYSQIEFGRALQYTDLTPFLIKCGKHWNAENFVKELKEVFKQCGEIIYIVADGGGAMCKSIRLLFKVHVYDITHKIAWILKKMYAEDKIFKKYSRAMSQMRFKFVCSDISHVIPTKQRSDSRFMNMDVLSDWGMKVINCIDSFDKSSKEYQKLKWVKPHKKFITELYVINGAITQIKSILKTKGLSNQTINETNEILEKLNMDNERIKYFCEEIKKYLKETKEQLPDEEKILCTSDIIESSFGKYKNNLTQNPTAGITNLSLCVSAFTSSLDAEVLKAGLESTKIADLKEWSKENIGETNLSKRKRVLRKIGG
jgi:hypothetical protein